MNWESLAGGLAAVAALIGAVLGGLKTYRSSREAARISAVDGFNRLVEALEKRLANVESTLTRAQTRIEILESQGDVDQAEIQELRRYIGYLQGFIGQHTAPGITPRPMPDSRRDL